jgi:hypothetical protein
VGLNLVAELRIIAMRGKNVEGLGLGSPKLQILNGVAPLESANGELEVKMDEKGLRTIWV